ncbi:MAG: alpha/beta hydrolase-fold protein [Oscillospiraceae bacterium]
MAFITTTLFSQVLNQRMPVDLFVPTDRKEGPLRQPRGVIYFLPGISANEKDFQQYTAVNRYAMENHMAMVYPTAPYSFYTDMAIGLNYYTYLTQELPKLVDEVFNLSFKREKTFVAGLSMGGYGALLLGMSRPDIYGGCASFSGSCDMGGMLKFAQTDPASKKIMAPAFGESLELEDRYDLFKLATKMSHLPKEEQSRVFMCCGKQDDKFLIHDQNIGLKTYMETLDLASYKYMEWDGQHDNSFWDRAMLHGMSFFLKNKYDEKKLELWRCEAK